MKKVPIFISVVILLGLCFGCRDQEATAELAALKAQAEVEEQNKALVIKMYEEIDKQNFDFVFENCAPDARLYGAGGFEPMTRNDLKPMFPMWFNAFPDYKHSVEDVFAKGDKVIARCIYTGTHEGEFMGAPPTGNSFKYLGIHIWRIQEGKLVEGWILEDMLYLMTQLGMELNPKQEK